MKIITWLVWGIMTLCVGCFTDSSGTDDTTENTGSNSTDYGDDCSSVEYEGEATFYDADGSGSCSFAPSPDNLMVAAMNEPDYQDSSVRGACVFVKGPLGEITVRIVDKCPGCASGDLDLSQLEDSNIEFIEGEQVNGQSQFPSCE